MWYDKFANFYDLCLDKTYVEHRHQAADALQLREGMSVVDVGCGTGASFPSLMAGIGEHGRLIGVDASPGMLKKAKARSRRMGWDNVELLEVELGDVEKRRTMREEIGSIDRVLCFLSLSVIDAYEEVLDEWFNALAPGGRLVIADVHNSSPGIYARLVEFISRATLNRQVWLPLARESDEFKLEWQQSSWVLGGEFFLASGAMTADEASKSA